ASNGIVDGLGDGRFGPDEEITREQMCALLMRYAAKSGTQLTEAGNTAVFNDEGTISEWSLENVNMAKQAGLIEGKADNCFDPQGVLTRAEAATIFMRFVQNTV
ncbi:MAG TPA: S-layer homology domain-containing protein, partial [Syntrophomonas sp.]|nr:S-layer homology domain-containing protein [Syntrophomonas sp.]